MVVRCTNSATGNSQASPPQIHPISPTSKSTPMNRQFPPEIIQLIVNASLKPYDVFESPATDAKMRYSLRKSYALLNSTWRGATQAELVKWVEIRTEDWAKKFLEFAEQRGGSVDGVKDMFVYSAHFTDARTLAKLLRCVPQLINFYVYGGSVDIYDLAQLQKLRRLELDNCSIVGTPSSSQRRLSQLQRLSIRDCPFEDSALQFLTPTFLPQLRRVDTPGLSIMAPLIPQLEIINARSGYGDFHLLARAKSLLLLPLPHSADKRLDMLANLPSLPPFLYPVIPPYNAVDASEELADALEDLLGTKKSGLRVILLKEYGIDDSIRSLIQRFEERGVRVQLVDLDFEGAIIEMEEIRANEKRAAEAAEARRR